MNYMPLADGDRIAWLANLSNQIETQKVPLELSDDTITEVKAYCSTAIDRLQAVVAAKKVYQGAIKDKDGMETKPNGELRALRTLITQWKTKDGFTAGIGNLLGIVGTADSVDPATYKASIAVSIQANVVRIKFTKNGADSINIYRRKKGSTDWQFLARDTSTPYDDHITLATPGQPEHWEYIAYGVIKDEEIGAPSEIAQIVYGGTA